MDSNWAKKARTLLRVELVRADISYGELARRLQEAGIDETDRSIANKLSRGTFSLAFFLQCMHVLGVRDVVLDTPEPVQAKAPRRVQPPPKPVDSLHDLIAGRSGQKRGK